MGNRWTQSRVASVRRKYRIATPDAAQINPDVSNLAQATSYSGVKDTTLMRLIKADILAAEQIAQYAPLEIKRSDLDSEPVSRIVKHLTQVGEVFVDQQRSALSHAPRPTAVHRAVFRASAWRWECSQ